MMSELFDTSVFSSKNNDAARDFEIEDISSKKKVQKSSYKSDSAWDDGSAFPEVSSLKWAIGDRVTASGDDKQSQAQSAVFSQGETLKAMGSPQEEQLCKRSLGTVTGVNKKITVTWQNGLSAEYTPKQMQSYGYEKFLEDEGAIAECNDSHNLISAQELVPVSPLPPQNLDLTSSEPQRLTPTVATSSQNDSQNCITTAIYENSPTLEPLDCDQEQLILSPLPHPALHSPQKDSAGEQLTNEIVFPQSSKLLQITNPDLPLLKMLQGCSLAPTSLEMSAVTSGMFFAHFPPVGTMRNGLLSEAATLMLPSLESEFCWLPSPGALSLIGKGRPPGQTKQEGGLKEKGAIAPGQVVNPEFLESAYNLPLGWTNPRENRSALELLAEMELSEVAVQPLETPLIGELPPLDFAASPTSTPYAENQSLVRANAQQGTYIIDKSEKLGIIEKNLGFGFVVNWFDSQFTYNWERNDQLINGLAIAPQSLITKFLEDNHPQLCTKCLKVVDRDYNCDKCPPIKCTQQSNNVRCPSCESSLITLNGGCGVCGWIPENFLEESQPQQEAVQKPKSKQRKGCLYKYLENKKLKNGTIASYPRVIGNRNPDNPTHWRWGFNWEEKMDGEWKGRSIGSVPVGAIALIQSMQNEGVSLEEIIGFIRRCKSKKS